MVISIGITLTMIVLVTLFEIITEKRLTRHREEEYETLIHSLEKILK